MFWNAWKSVFSAYCLWYYFIYFSCSRSRITKKLISISWSTFKKNYIYEKIYLHWPLVHKLQSLCVCVCLFIRKPSFPTKCQQKAYWVNPSKRGGMDGAFWGLAGLLRGISLGRSQREILRSRPEGNPEEQPYQPEQNPVHPDSITWIYILFEIRHFGDISDFFLNINVWRSMIVAKFLKYVHRMIRKSIVLLWHCYVPKIQFIWWYFHWLRRHQPF